MGVARRPNRWMATDEVVRVLQRLDEAQGRRFARVIQATRDGCVHIPVGLFTPDDGLGLHPFAAGLAALRTRSRRPSK